MEINLPSIDPIDLFLAPIDFAKSISLAHAVKKELELNKPSPKRFIYTEIGNPEQLSIFTSVDTHDEKEQNNLEGAP